jgi:hypothetical protein
MKRICALLVAVTGGISPATAQNFLPDCPDLGLALPIEAVAWLTMPSDEGYEGELLGGTVWFIGKQQVVAVLHDHADVLADWTEITLSTGNQIGEAPIYTRSTLARLLHTIETGTDEKLYIVELAETFTDIEVPKIRFDPLSDKEPVYSLTYDDGVFALATGRHLLPEQSTDAANPGDPPPPFLMFELADPSEKDRLVIDAGSSGSPIFDCQGHVVSAVAMVLTQELNLMGVMRVSTAWGEPNVYGVSINAITKPFE